MAENQFPARCIVSLQIYIHRYTHAHTHTHIHIFASIKRLLTTCMVTLLPFYWNLQQGLRGSLPGQQKVPRHEGMALVLPLSPVYPRCQDKQPPHLGPLNALGLRRVTSHVTALDGVPKMPSSSLPQTWLQPSWEGDVKTSAIWERLGGLKAPSRG